MRQCITILTILILSGCSTSKVPQSIGIIGETNSYLGSIASDEARASLVGRDELSIGGNSSDAAVAMAFALMVSRPDAAGAGGGGVCWDAVSGRGGPIGADNCGQSVSRPGASTATATS